ncbi:type II secretion system F family protein [Ornithinimicrobium kibberense]
MLDQLSIAVEAGLGFEGALAHVARNTTGPLSDEVVRTLQDIQVGVPRKVAYQLLGERIELPELRRFLRAIIQAEEHGISVARVLSIQASEMRVTRRLRAEEKAMRIPVLVALPLFLCIFPALLVVVLGPAVINIIEAFTGGLIVPTAG